MQAQLAQCVNKGMQRDYSMDKSSQEFAYENKNIRITSTGNNSFLSITNERSTVEYDLIQVIQFVYSWENDIPVTNDIINVDLSIKVLLSNGEELTSKIITEGTHSTLISNDIIEYINNNSLTIKSIESLDERYQFVTKYERPDPNFMNNKIILGDCTLGDYLVLFVKDTDTQKDIIYRLSIHPEHENVFYVKTLYTGNLNFDITKGIECIASYEADNVQKVYWVDGVNQPRYINICKTYEETESFNFVPPIESDIEVNITKEYKGVGSFSTGVIQYFITYYKKFGAESNAVYTSSLYYISPEDRGDEPNTTQTCSFNLEITIPDNNYDGIKVYSLIRSSYNTTPEAYLVYEGSVSTDRSFNIIDTGKNIPIAPTDIQFLGGNTIIASTIESKDNTLFLGDIKVMSEKLVTNLPNNFKEYVNLSFVYRYLPMKSKDDDAYSYSPNLTSSSEDSRYFKYKEWYRFGIQFETNTGEWGSPIFLCDKQCDLPLTKYIEDNNFLYKNIEIEQYGDEYDYIYVPAIKCSIENIKSINDFIKENNIINWRIVVAEHNDSTRTIKAQGLLLPTLYNIVEKNKELCSYTPLWNMGLVQQAKHLENIENIYSVNLTDGTNYIGKYESYPTSTIDASVYNDQKMLKTLLERKSGTESKEGYFLSAIEGVVTGGRTLKRADKDSLWVNLTIYVGKINETDDASVFNEYRYTINDLALSERCFGQGKKVCRECINRANGIKWQDIADSKLYINHEIIPIKDIKGIDLNSYIFKPGDLYTVEETIEACVPFYYDRKHELTKGKRARNVVYSKNENTLNEHENEYFFNANICNFLSPDVENVTSGLKFRLIGYTDINNSISDYTIKSETDIDSQGNIIKEGIYNFNFYNKTENRFSGITSAPLWPNDNKMFWVYYWQHSGDIAGQIDPHNVNSIVSSAFPIKTKKYANMWYCKETSFLNDYITYPIADVDVIYDDTALFQSEIYKKKYENLLIPKTHWMWFKDASNITTPLVDLFNIKTSAAQANNNIIKTTSIKANSSIQCVVDLGNSESFQYILPNYRSVYDDSIVNGIMGEDFIRNDNYVSVGGASIVDKTSFFNITIDNKAATFDDLLNVLLEADTLARFYIYVPTEGVLAVQGKFLNGLATTCAFTINSPTIKDGIPVQGDLKLPSITGCIPTNYNSIVTNLYFRIKDGDKLLYNIVILAAIGKGYASYSFPTVYNKIEFSNSKLSCKNNNVVYLDREDYFEVLMGTSISPKLGTSKLWIGEFYTDYEEESFMGGISENNIKYNTFIPVSGKYSMQLSEDNTYVGYGIEGDTYYQRWDHLRIMPISEEDVNQPIDALSIMVETHKNLDGDVRALRGRRDVINLNEDNTNNVLNDVYSQSNNYLTYNILDDKFSKYHHPTMYMWSLSKQPLADIDNWTQINLLSANELDGDKGALSKIKKWNNKLVAFQDKAIALINFNNQTTISTSEGVPVEIANSGKVQGHYYFSTNNGCKNKWSIIDTPSGLYFIDSYNKAINLINEGISSLSTLHLLQDWINENEFNSIWQPNGNAVKGFKTFYDPIHKEVYFVNGNDCLCYSELLAQFTSFYDYERLDTFTPINGKLYGIPYNEEKLKVYKMFDGDTYCNLFDKQVDYYMQYKINKDPFIDKTWTNVEYRADIFESGKITSNDSNKVINKTFDTLTVWDEYQSGIEDLSKARNKFRIWRANIPRDTKNSKFGLDRIRNPWIMLELRKDADSDESTVNRMEFHDLVIKYLA